MRPDETTTPIFRGVLILVAVGVILTAISLFTDTARFNQAYFIAFVLWTEVAVGCLGIVLLNNLVAGRWLHSIQRFAEAGARTLPLTAVFFLPVAVGLSDIYPWAIEGAEKMKGAKEVLLQPGPFVVRTFIYIAIWSILAYVLTNWSYRREAAGEPAQNDASRNFAAVGAVIYVLSTSLAGFDWTMSITPEWFASGYGWLSLARMAISAFSLLLILVAFFWSRDAYKDFFPKKVINDLAALMLVVSLVFAYMHVTQFVIIWQGNVAFNVLWYDLRVGNSWQTLTYAVVGIHALLLLGLMTPGIKGSRGPLLGFALVTFVMRFVTLFWVVMPGVPGGEQAAFSPWDVGATVLLGGVWLAVMLFFLGQHSLFPENHPALLHVDTHGGSELHEAT